ncbi:MAG: hypothetical protein JNJ90_19620 [Saprospiraceae bacterium]|jgi:hypothetical protein|nr:hypothetical protein [Saprospiraceae bacterium]
MVKFRFFATIFTLFIAQIANSQGCSDAGVCTLNGFKPQESGDATGPMQNQVKAGVSFGGADNSISILSNHLEYNRQFGDKLSADLRLTSLSQSGNGISRFNLSDIYLTANYAASEMARFTAGLKIPLNSANTEHDGIPLPMDYQSSLGTFDLVLGFGFAIRKLQLAVALQQPLTQNENVFLAANSPAEALREFPSTNQFQRSGDVLLRLSYPLSLGEKLTLTPSVLPIFHLANDKYTDETNVEREIEGSQGLTLNANAFLDYNLSESSALQLGVGLPLVVRDARPDGLTRSFLASLEYRVRF